VAVAVAVVEGVFEGLGEDVGGLDVVGLVEVLLDEVVDGVGEAVGVGAGSRAITSLIRVPWSTLLPWRDWSMTVFGGCVLSR
jgi:hypothetical protein